MTIEEMKARKKELGYTNETLAEASGVPLGTVQKIFAGVTASPRKGTIHALTSVLEKKETDYDIAGARSGMLHEMADPGAVHQSILLEMAVQIRESIRKTGAKCRVLLAPFAVQLGQQENTVVQPDLTVICDRSRLQKYTYVGAPEFVVEILSANSRSRDTVLKLYKYKNAGVREYWIVDPERQTVMVYAFETEEYPKMYMRNARVPVFISGGKCSVDFQSVFDEVQDLP